MTVPGYLTTATGRQFSFERPTVEMVDLRDVVHATSMVCRFVGHSSRFLSVAEHMVRCCLLAEVDYGPGSLEAKCALLHDAPEAYVADVPATLKHLLPDYLAVEARVTDAVIDALGLPPRWDPVWKRAKVFDEVALHLEAAEVMHPRPSWVQPVDARFDCVREFGCPTPGQARVEFAKKLVEYGFRGSLRHD